MSGAPDPDEEGHGGRPRLRFAPSPTGYLHIGGARTALFNYLYARQHDGVFLLRIEDTDRERSTESAVRAILDGLRYLGLEWDEGPGVGGDYGPYFQSERAAEHRDLVDRLLKSNRAYRCFCSRQRLESLREAQRAAKERVHYDRRCRQLDSAKVERRLAAGEPSVVRFFVEEGETVVEDLIRGRVVFNHRDIDDFIIQRADGSCVYNLAVVGDDGGMRITHVIRGEDHLTNTPKQVLLFEALGLPVPRYAHIPLILGPGRQKLSKRHGAVSVTEYQEKGYLPEAMVNFLVRLGWSYDDREEIFSMEDLIEKFSLKGISRGGGMYDLKKLNHLGAHWLQQRSVAEVFELAVPHILASGWVCEEDLEAEKPRLLGVLELEKDRMEYLAQIGERLAYYYGEIEEIEPKAAKTLAKSDREAVSAQLAEFAGEIERVFDSADRSSLVPAIEEATRSFVESRGLALKDLAQPMRAVLTGRSRTPPLFDVMALLGKDRCLHRLRDADRIFALAAR